MSMSNNCCYTGTGKAESDCHSPHGSRTLEYDKLQLQYDALERMKTSEHNKLKLEIQKLQNKLEEIESSHKAICKDLINKNLLVCKLQCDIQSLVDKTSSNVEVTCPYISQGLSTKTTEGTLAELLRVQKAISAMYKARADRADSLQRQLDHLKSKLGRKFDMTFNLQVKVRHRCAAEELTAEEVVAQQQLHHLLHEEGGATST